MGALKGRVRRKMRRRNMGMRRRIRRNPMRTTELITLESKLTSREINHKSRDRFAETGRCRRHIPASVAKLSRPLDTGFEPPAGHAGTSLVHDVAGSGAVIYNSNSNSKSNSGFFSFESFSAWGAGSRSGVRGGSDFRSPSCTGSAG